MYKIKGFEKLDIEAIKTGWNEIKISDKGNFSWIRKKSAGKVLRHSLI